MEKAKLCELLGLDLESTEEQIAAEIIKIKTAATDSTTQIEAANAEAEDAKKKEEEKEEAFANERKSRIALILDNAIAGGNITPAMRPAWKKKLEANIGTGALALANEQTIKTKSVSAGLSPERTANTSGILALANEKMADCKGLTFEAAWAQVKKERPDLFGPQ